MLSSEQIIVQLFAKAFRRKQKRNSLSFSREYCIAPYRRLGHGQILTGSQGAEIPDLDVWFTSLQKHQIWHQCSLSHTILTFRGRQNFDNWGAVNRNLLLADSKFNISYYSVLKIGWILVSGSIPNILKKI